MSQLIISQNFKIQLRIINLTDIDFKNKNFFKIVK